MKRLFTTALASLFIAAPASGMSCTPGPYIVFFMQRDGVHIDAEAASILDAAVDSIIKSDCETRVRVSGFADRSGGKAHNLALARRRANAVKAYLIAHGFAAGLITIEAVGEDPSGLRMPTKDGVAEVQNRRVEILPIWEDGLVTPSHPAAPPRASSLADPE